MISIVFARICNNFKQNQTRLIGLVSIFIIHKIRILRKSVEHNCQKAQHKFLHIENNQSPLQKNIKLSTNLLL